MIGYIEGKILKKEEERILVLANQIGYEVLLPAIVMETMQDKQVGDDVSLYIFFQNYIPNSSCVCKSSIYILRLLEKKRPR